MTTLSTLFDFFTLGWTIAGLVDALDKEPRQNTKVWKLLVRAFGYTVKIALEILKLSI